MRELIIFLSVCILLLPSVHGAAISELSDEQLFRGMNGFPEEGYTREALETELRSEGAKAFVERCKRSEELRKMMAGFPQVVIDPELKDDLVNYILGEDSIWTDQQRMSQALSMRAYAFAYPALVDQFFLTEEPKDSSIALCLLTPKGRGELLDLHVRLLRLERSERNPGNAKMIDLIDSVRKVVATYGTDEYLRGGSAKENPRRLPDRRSMPVEKDSSPEEASRPPDAADSSPPLARRQGMLFWMAISAIIVLGAVVVKKWAF